MFSTVVYWLQLASRCLPSLSLSHSSSAGQRRKMYKIKIKNVWVKIKVVWSKNQRPCMEKKENVLSNSVSRWCPVTSWEIGPQNFALQDRCLNIKCSPTFSSFLSSFIADYGILWCGNFSQFGSTVLVKPSPGVLLASSLPAFEGGDMGWERALMLCEHCSAVP